MTILTNEWSIRALIGVLAFTSGCLFGNICPWPRVGTWKGEPLYKPDLKTGWRRLLHPKLKSDTKVIIFILIMALISTVLTFWTRSESLDRQEQYVNQQANCNFEYRRVLNERSELTNDRQKNIDNVILGTIAIVSAPPSDVNRMKFLALLNDYKTERDRITQALADNPYPDPRCDISSPHK